MPSPLLLQKTQAAVLFAQPTNVDCVAVLNSLAKLMKSSSDKVLMLPSNIQLPPEAPRLVIGNEQGAQEQFSLSMVRADYTRTWRVPTEAFVDEVGKFAARAQEMVSAFLSAATQIKTGRLGFVVSSMINRGEDSMDALQTHLQQAVHIGVPGTVKGLGYSIFKQEATSPAATNHLVSFHSRRLHNAGVPVDAIDILYDFNSAPPPAGSVIGTKELVDFYGRALQVLTKWSAQCPLL